MTTPDIDLREHVRVRYAAAATAVTAGGTNTDLLAAELLWIVGLNGRPR